MKLVSTSGIIDISTGRGALVKRLLSRPTMGECPAKNRTPVTITGYIESIYGDFDGTDQSFNIVVESIEAT